MPRLKYRSIGIEELQTWTSQKPSFITTGRLLCSSLVPKPRVSWIEYVPLLEMQMQEYKKQLLRYVLVRLDTCLYLSNFLLRCYRIMLSCQQNQCIFWFFYPLRFQVFYFDVLFFFIVCYYWLNTDERKQFVFPHFSFCLTITV